ncbi:oligopeptide/dipeptide ABC transporter ATP-binding protein [Ferroplasma sp.]|uniref:oligopeptide/dipeptide ABC transporter ATP-binding protein n=1 Tax=Ferroplasma sp. TaxID=2591003 RepID=UPI00307E38E7
MIEVIDLNSGYYNDGRYTEILKNINMNINENEIVGILGPNGSGKTTLMKSIIGDIYARNGNVLYKGNSIYDKKNYRNYRNSIIYVKQDSLNSLKPLKTVNFQIGKLYNWKSFDKERVISLFKDLELNPEIFRMKATQLSDGMRHRVVIAMALLKEPKLLVLDEPTTGLDSRSIYKFLKLLKNIKAHTSILISSNDVNSLFEIADRVYILYGGQIIESGEYGEILKNPEHPFTDMLFKYVPVYSNRNRKFIPVNNQKNSGCVFIGNCPYLKPACEKEIEYKCINGHCFRCMRYPGWKND